MKIFFSWSGDLSRSLADVFYRWLPKTLEHVKIFFSPQIEKGTRWREQLMLELQETSAGLFFVTADNVGSQWLNFEAGALSKAVAKAKLYSILFDFTPEILVGGPLEEYQQTLFNKNDICQLVTSINTGSGPEQVPHHTLERMLEGAWPQLNLEVNQVLAQRVNHTSLPESVPIDCYLRATNLPAFVTNEKSVLTACNSHLLEFWNCKREAIIGKSAYLLRDLVGKRVAKPRRDEFKQRQKEIIENVIGEEGPNQNDYELIDNSDLNGSVYEGYYFLWIHSVQLCDDNRPTGHLVIYHPQKIDQKSFESWVDAPNLKLARFSLPSRQAVKANISTENPRGQE